MTTIQTWVSNGQGANYLSQTLDSTTGLHVEFDASGNQVISQPLSTAETARLATLDAHIAVRSNKVSVTAAAQTALAANATDQTQDQAIITQAATITAASITNLATAATAIAKLAQAVSILASNDINTKKELNAIIRLVLNQFDSAT